ncbi:MAG TPA: papain-like cysteine protease family protein [Humisphaera sp.]|nr:papain-like cysteine protease family protein [Humisphaera sp.]
MSSLILACLILAGCSASSSVEPSQLRPLEEHPTEMQKVFAPPMVEVPQQTPNWCWAACFQTILLSSGVPTTQRTIVKDVMGTVVNEKVTVEQLMHAFNSRGVSVTYVPGKPSRDQILSFLNSDKPSMRHLIVQRRENGTIDWHAVVIWGYEIPADGRLYVYMYDPESNHEYKDWYAYDDHWQASFFVTVNRMEAFDQWLGTPPVSSRR